MKPVFVAIILKPVFCCTFLPRTGFCSFFRSSFGCPPWNRFCCTFPLEPVFVPPPWNRGFTHYWNRFLLSLSLRIQLCYCLRFSGTTNILNQILNYLNKGNIQYDNSCYNMYNCLVFRFFGRFKKR